jgi:predicted amidohydrolase
VITAEPIAALARTAAARAIVLDARDGAADTSVALARGSMAEILDWLDRHNAL